MPQVALLHTWAGEDQCRVNPLQSYYLSHANWAFIIIIIIIKHNDVSCLDAGLRRQADEDVQTVRDVKMEEARIIREQNIRRRAERRADDTGRTHSPSRK